MIRAIVNAAVGDHYLRLRRSTARACLEFAPAADLLLLSPDPPWNYGMKLDAIRAAQELGSRYVVWMDCSFKPTASMSLLWTWLCEQGWYAPIQGSAKLGEWASDDALRGYGITRDVAWVIPMCLSGLVGFDLQHPMGVEILRAWRTLRHTFAGPHRNVPGGSTKPWGNKFEGHVSDDPRVAGHRNDESALSFVLWTMGLRPVANDFLAMQSEETGFIGRNFQRVNGTYAD